jgi:hypothetical protein
MLVFSKTNKYVHQLVNINIYIKMHGAPIRIIKYKLHISD